MPRYIDAVKVEKWSLQEPRYSDSINDRTDLRDFLRSLPTVSPDKVRGVGKWIRIPGFHLDHEYYPDRFQCDQCKHFVDSGDDRNYCPNCGAKMEVSEDD